MKVLAPNPECKLCKDDPGFLRVAFGDGHTKHEIVRIKDSPVLDIPLRIACSCVRAAEIVAVDTITIFGSKPIHRPLPIVEAGKPK